MDKITYNICNMTSAFNVSDSIFFVKMDKSPVKNVPPHSTRGGIRDATGPVFVVLGLFYSEMVQRTTTDKYYFVYN